MKYMLGLTHPAMENAHMAASTVNWGESQPGRAGRGEKRLEKDWGGEEGESRPRGDGKGLSRACHIVPSSAPAALYFSDPISG